MILIPKKIRFTHPLIWILLCLAGLNASCSEGGFTGGSKVGVKKPVLSQDALPEASPTPSPGVVVDETGRACVRSGAPKVVNLGVAPHVDSAAAGEFAPAPTADIASSVVLRIDRAEIGGDLLPLEGFVVDDIAMIVKADVLMNDILKCSDCRNSREVIVPAHAMLLYDSTNPRYAEGSLDSHANTVYRFGAKSVNLPARQNKSLRDVSALGIPLIAANAIKLEDMKKKGFINANGEISFKVLHVSHRWGTVGMTFKLMPCK